MNKIGLTVICILLLAVCAGAIRIRVNGSWTETIDIADLVGPPGSDLVSSYESATNQIDIDIDYVDEVPWSVDVRRVDSNWHANFQLFVRRTSSHYRVYGGTTYQEVTTSNQDFFYTTQEENDEYNIKVQLRLDGVSIQIPPGTYTTTVYYTVTE